MKVEMKTCMAGPEGTAYPGQKIDLEHDRAVELIKGGYAVALEEDEKLEIYPKHIAGGLYLLSDGTKVKGKEAAIEAQKVLEGGAE